MCVFCDIVNHKIPSYVVYEDEQVLAILDQSQITYGHTIVMPKKHVTSLLTCDEETALACMKVIVKLSRQIVANTGAVGCNVLNNNGIAAGQSIDHLHFHIIPRYPNDHAIELEKQTVGTPDYSEILKKVKGE